MFLRILLLQQHTVCAAEEQSDDEVRTSQVPERSEGKTKVMWKLYLPFTVLKLYICTARIDKYTFWVATVLTVYGIETGGIALRVLESYYPVATVPTVYGMRRRVRDSRGAKRR